MSSTDRALLRDRLELRIELEDIGEALAAIERRDGLHESIEAVRQRQQRARGIVAAQVRALLDTEATRVH